MKRLWIAAVAAGWAWAAQAGMGIVWSACGWIVEADDDWTLGGYAGVALAASVTDRLELSLGAEARFPHRTLRFDDDIVSGNVELAKWSAFASLGFRF